MHPKRHDNLRDKQEDQTEGQNVAASIEAES